MHKQTTLRAIPDDGRLVGLVLVLAAASGCATIPAPIAPPSGNTGWQTVSTHAIGYGVARATIQTANGNRIAVSGNGDHQGGVGNPGTTVVPIILPAAASLYWRSPEIDGSVFAGWRRAGFTSRLRLRETGRHRIGTFVDGNIGWFRTNYDVGSGIELYSDLSENFSVLLRLGPSFGRRNYAVTIPAEISGPSPGWVGWTAMDIFRNDWRAEGMLGVMFRDHVLISLRPYRVLSSARLRSSCGLCGESVTLIDFKQDWGMVFMVSFLRPNTGRP